jgi:shikimate dehydrogenase
MNPIQMPSTRTATGSIAAQEGGYAVFGNPIAQSLSPAMHAAAFKGLGIKSPYLAYQAENAEEIVRTMRRSGILGASITIPFKETVLPLLDELDETALAIGAVNTIVNRGGRLAGYNTDAPGMIRDVASWMEIPGKTFVVFGAGGAARAAIFALLKAGGKPVVVNRTPERARGLAERFGCRWAATEQVERLEADCLINTTPLGMFPHHTDLSPLPARTLRRFTHVLDMVYNPLKTRLLKDAEQAGCAIHPGSEMFVQQGAEQIRLWMGIEPPEAPMRKVIMERLTGHGRD